MHRLFALLVLALAACGEREVKGMPDRPPAPAAADGAAAPAGPAITGEFVAISNTATSLTGDLSATPDVLSFARGFRLEGGRVDAALTIADALYVGGGTIADASGNAGADNIEVRRIENVRVAADAPAPNLCTNGPVRHVVLAQSVQTLSLLVFSGADAPGRNAQNAQLCAVFNYAP